MADIYLYADETGNLDMVNTSTEKYFGFGTAIFRGDHGQEAWDGQCLRFDLAHRGHQIRQKFHAVDDRPAIRTEVFDLISRQAPQFDVTLLNKQNVQPQVQAQGQMYLYKMAWYLHAKSIIPWNSKPGDTVYVVVATLGTNARQAAAETAIQDVIRQVGQGRHVVMCNWASESSWGLQVADYGLWAAQRTARGLTCAQFATHIKPLLKTNYRPWGR